jgi:GH25 family lysozyme M1 (1,4-beta-N-acetylmuramidase)
MPFAMLPDKKSEYSSCFCFKNMLLLFYPIQPKEEAMPFVKGIDVSVFDPVINWAKVRAQGYRFAYIRSSYGVDNNITITDTMFQAHWAGAKAAGMLRGPYHYLKASQDGTRQAEEFLKIVTLEQGDLPPALDLEEAYNQGATNRQFITNAGAFLQKVKAELGITPMVYSRGMFLDEKLTLNGQPPAWAKNYRMWVAHWTYAYGENIIPIQGAGWTPYIFWQYSGEKEHLDGITDDLGRPVYVDFDVFKGTLEDLYLLANATPPVSKKYIVQAGDTLENIAKDNNLSLAELVNANPQILTAGMELTLPAPAGAGEAVSSGDSDADSDTTDTTDDSNVRTVSYTVKAGDTLSAIAIRFSSTVKAIADFNHIPDPNRISIGQVLLIPQ